MVRNPLACRDSNQIQRHTVSILLLSGIRTRENTVKVKKHKIITRYHYMAIWELGRTNIPFPLQYCDCMPVGFSLLSLFTYLIKSI